MDEFERDIFEQIFCLQCDIIMIYFGKKKHRGELINVFKLKFKSKVVLLSMLLLFTWSITASAAQQSERIALYEAPIHFIFNGYELAPPNDQKAFIYQNRTYVPLRFISYALHYSVSWNASTYTVSLSDPLVSEQVPIREYDMIHQIVGAAKPTQVDGSKLAAKEADVYAVKVTYMFNGTEKTPAADLSGIIYNNRIFVPIRFVSDLTGKDIGWDPATYTISLVSKGDQQNASQSGTANTNSKISLNTLLDQTDQQIVSLKSQAFSDFGKLLDQYKSTTDSNQKTALLAQGKTVLAQYDQKFSELMKQLTAQLTANGYSTDIVQQYMDVYQKLKQDAITQIIGQIAS